uniref:TBC1 domain family member 5 n=1 Tax=Labrus bergylta TaxID=56723 RepID=A0A3Q3EIU3_9LABR
MQHPNFETRHPLQTDEQQETGLDPHKSLRPLCRKEWDDLFLNSNYLARIRQAGINGRLRSSRFRSVCWKLYLEALPEDKGQWINKTKELRAQYEKIKETHITNPRKAAGQQDLVVNNPLSQDEGSLWNKFFQDKELKGMIKQDVLRTFPEIRYFQDEDVKNEQLYKQGMHELLAPIVFVLHCDHQAFQHASETASPRSGFHNSETLSYALFSQLMETAEPWFSSYEREVRKGKEEMLTSIPFARPQDSGPSVAIVTKVNRIQDQLVKKHDVELHMHVNRLEIAPQIYGIRWVRLLFGREFPLQDLLVVWDALFADSITLDLVDYIFVAMLLYIRDALIASNFQTCLGLLMHYPPLGDINSLLQKALFLRDPKNNPRPVNYQFQQNLDYYKTRGADLMNKTRTKTAPLNINKVSSSLLSFGRKLISPAISSGSSGVSPINSEVHSTSSSSSSLTVPLSLPAPTLPHPLADPPSGQAPPQLQSHTQNQHYRLLKSESMPVHLSKGQSSRTVSSSPSIESLSGGRGHTSSPPLSATKKESFFNITRSRSHSKSMGKKETVSRSDQQSNQMFAFPRVCPFHCKIQEVILQENLEKEDEVLVSLAGLKQIKDILKGSLRFNQSQLEAEENEEITIADDHYTSSAMIYLDCSKIVLLTPFMFCPAQVASSLGSEGKNWDDYILVSQDGDLQPAEAGGREAGGREAGGRAAAERTPPIGRGRGMVRLEPEGAAGTFHDPLMAGPNSGSSSPDEGSTHSKDSDFTIVNPNDL